MEDRSLQFASSVSFGLSATAVGIILGIVLTVLEISNIIHIGLFWATFSFWIVPATIISLSLIVLFVAGIFYIFETLKARRLRNE